MRSHVLLFVLTLLSAGCAVNPKWTELAKPTTERHFVLEKDHVRSGTAGLNVPFVDVLRAGTYRLAAEDERGQYYLGEGLCVVVQQFKDADQFLATGKINPGGALPVYGAMNGGLWIPKEGVKADPRLFVIVGAVALPDQQQLSAAVLPVADKSGASGAGAGLGVALVTGIIASGKGRVEYVLHASEKDFVPSIQFVDGPPPPSR